jgi:hypothetical protein
MGIDYDSLGGIGIFADETIIYKLIDLGVFTEDEWKEDPHRCMKQLGIPYNTAGHYDQPRIFFWLVKGTNLVQINENKEDFKNQFKNIGLFLEDSDLTVINEVEILWPIDIY